METTRFFAKGFAPCLVPRRLVAPYFRRTLRVARPSDDLAALVKFYRDGLGFDVLYEFKDHEGFDGVMLGRKGAAYHLEFTRKAGHAGGRGCRDRPARGLVGQPETGRQER